MFKSEKHWLRELAHKEKKMGQKGKTELKREREPSCDSTGGETMMFPLGEESRSSLRQIKVSI